MVSFSVGAVGALEQKRMPPIVETVFEEENDDDFDQASEWNTFSPSWFPRPIYNVASSATYESRTDLDSHADTTVLGKHCEIIYTAKRTADVSPFLPELGTAEKVPIVCGAIAYDNPDGETIVLIIHQALYIPALRDNLLCDNQCRMNDVVVDACPKSLSENPTDSTHTIKFRNNDDFTIPMGLRGTISYFPSRKPTARELHDCRRIELTAEQPEWNPHARLFDENENAMTDEDGFIKQNSRRRTIMKAKTDLGSEIDAHETSESMSAVPRVLSDISNTLNDNLFVSAIRSTVETSYDDFIKAKTTPESMKTNIASTKSKARYKLSPEILSQKWNIGLDAAKRTLQVTTQRGLKTVADPSITR